MMLMPFLLLLAVAPLGTLASLPYPVATTYNSLDPQASAQFMIDYFGALSIPSNTTSCSSVTSSWVRFPTSNYEFHFISTPSLAADSFTFSDFEDYAHLSFGNLTEVSASTYTQFMDFHVGMITDDMTPFYQALKVGGVPFFMVGQYPSFFDLFVEIPGTATILEITSQRLDVPDAKISEWDICQVNGTSSSWKLDPQPLPNVSSSVARDGSRGESWPVINWRKTTMAAPHPALAEIFTIKHLGGKHVQQGHPGVWVRRCAKISWVEFEYPEGTYLPGGINYQFHFVDGYKYPPHEPEMTIETFAEKVEKEVRDFGGDSFDEFAHNRVTMWVDDLDYYAEQLVGNEFGVEWIFRTDGGGVYYLVIDSAGITGNVIELVSDKAPVGAADVKTWEEDLCQNSEQ
ncbi:hypothetical protein TrRE_jg4798 [Triparma retinervis]|uniref:Uncharacterized protein n=1 Tax=Triparma retinervis TaxID=2557542 RepID=A0A9W6ZEK7_9STRA|nr:hypothetical protein TrRE_jg4798 [Triparma retinervis]